uniref:Uncharacterized protein n=1 Tax=Caenorhabditis japonica TaxID=281687 RepID=A0A8R1DMD0_CAEJA
MFCQIKIMGKSRSKSKSASCSRSAVKDKKKKKEAKEAKLSEEKSAGSTGKSLSAESKSKSSQLTPKKSDDGKKSSESGRKEDKKEKRRDRDKGNNSEEKSANARKSAEERSADENNKSAETVKKSEKDKEDASIFEEVAGPASPAQANSRGIKNKMRWKIDVEPVDVNGEQKMSDVLEKLDKLRKKNKAKGDESSGEELIMMSARVLQLVKLEALISKEITDPDQEILKSYCRSGDQEGKAEALLEKITLVILNAIVSKNEFVRQITIPGQLRMFAVDEKKAKLPMMALIMARKDLFYTSWSKPNRDVEKDLDGTWTNMTVKKGKDKDKDKEKEKEKEK